MALVQWFSVVSVPIEYASASPGLEDSLSAEVSHLLAQADPSR